jgi:deazaflavin-dependent oxidoreductase (nitroreductase family)
MLNATAGCERSLCRGCSRYAFRVPFPQWLARLNKVGLNRVVRHVAPRAPGLGLVVHRGRRSGRVYETPVNVFPAGDGFLMALTYGREKTDWVKNVVAAGGCELRTGGRVFQVESPRAYHDETRHDIPPVQRQVLRLLGAADFLSVQIVR